MALGVFGQLPFRLKLFIAKFAVEGALGVGLNVHLQVLGRGESSFANIADEFLFGRQSTAVPGHHMATQVLASREALLTVLACVRFDTGVVMLVDSWKGESENFTLLILILGLQFHLLLTQMIRSAEFLIAHATRIWPFLWMGGHVPFQMCGSRKGLITFITLMLIIRPRNWLIRR